MKRELHFPTPIYIFDHNDPHKYPIRKRYNELDESR
jgi:hypothetical protein